MFRILAPLAFSVGLKAAKDSITPTQPAPSATTQPAKAAVPASQTANKAALYVK